MTIEKMLRKLRAAKNNVDPTIGDRATIEGNLTVSGANMAKQWAMIGAVASSEKLSKEQAIEVVQVALASTIMRCLSLAMEYNIDIEPKLKECVNGLCKVAAARSN